MIPLPLILLLALPPTHTQGELVIVKEGTSGYHRPGCEEVRDGKGVLAMTRAQAEARGHKAHSKCDPANQPPPATTTPGPAASGAAKKKTSPDQTVYVDAAGKYYHRETCKRRGKNAKKLALDEAGRKYWPCSVCRPPIRPRKR